MSLNLTINYVDQDTGIHINIPILQVGTIDTKKILKDHEKEIGSPTNLQVLNKYEEYLHKALELDEISYYLDKVENMRLLSTKLFIFAS
jgi:hypothetical protein